MRRRIWVGSAGSDMANGLLTPSLLARITLLALNRRMYGDISAFNAHSTFNYHPMDLTKTVDDWEDYFIDPALNVALAYVEDGAGSEFRVPPNVYGKVERFNRIEARVITNYAIGMDANEMRIDVRYPV